jgi:hypothetical protein
MDKSSGQFFRIFTNFYFLSNFASFLGKGAPTKIKKVCRDLVMSVLSGHHPAI